jgi:hypothetical protein
MDQQIAEQLAQMGLCPRGVKRPTSRRHLSGRRRSHACSGCGGERDRGPYQAFCRKCHNEYARATRPKHSELNPEARRRANCRRLTNMHIARGKLAKTPCACGSTDGLQARQLGDYSSPFDVDFVCKSCRTGVRHVAAA